MHTTSLVPRARALLCALAVWVPSLVSAATLPVAPGQSVQAAIDRAKEGDTVALEAGVYHEDIDFRGKRIRVLGVGPETVLEGSGAGSVVTFAEGETSEAVLDSLTVTGGEAGLGGGIHIAGASPTILRTVITENRARFQGSGVYIERGSPQLVNNLIVYNSSAQNDPHSVEIVDASPTLVNNTIARGDSNGIILRGASAAVIVNNMIVYNGSIRGGARRGRGICDFSGGLARIEYNLFARNRVAALLTGGTDYRLVTQAERTIGPPRLVGNINGPAATTRRPSREPARATILDFRLRASAAKVPARDAGNPAAQYDDADGSRNDIGVGGGPLAPDWSR